MSEPWDRAAWEEKVNDVERRLAELYAIDHLIDRYVRQGPGGMVSTNARATVGRSYPFQVWLGPEHHVGEQDQGAGGEGTSIQQAEKFAREVIREAENYGETCARLDIDAFRSKVRELLTPVATEFGAVARSLESGVQRPLQMQVENDFTSLIGSLDSWEGEAANEFQVFYTGVEAAVERQRVVSAIIGNRFAGAGAIVALGQSSLTEIVGAAHRVIDQLLQQRAVNYAVRSMEASDYLMLAASVVGLIAAPFSGGTSATAVVAGTASLLQVAAQGVEHSKAAAYGLQLQGKRADDVRNAMLEKAEEINDRVRNHWDGLLGGVNLMLENLGLADGAEGGGGLYPRRPARLFDGITPGEFRHESGS